MTMMLRRAMMAPQAAAGLGEFTAGYSATLTPDSGTAWVITHNLGVVPKIVIVEMVGTPAATNYANREMVVLASNLPDDNTGYFAYEYYYNGADNKSSQFIGTTYYEADTATVTMKPPYNSARSSWDTGTTYHVQIYG